MFECVEWEVRHPLTGLEVAIVRLVRLGPQREPYHRAVTAHPNPAERRLIGYYASADDAHDASLWWLEQATQRGVGGGNKLPSARFVEQKPPPERRYDPADRGIPTGVDTVWSSPRRG